MIFKFEGDINQKCLNNNESVIWWGTNKTLLKKELEITSGIVMLQ